MSSLGQEARPLSRRTIAAICAAIVGIVLCSFLLPSNAAYDPWSWIVWGREIWSGDLSTTYGPSWKPLTVFFTTLAAPFGGSAPEIWIGIARAGALGGIVLGARLAWRLGGPIAGAVTGLMLLLAPWELRHGWLANSEGLLVALLFAAAIAAISGRRYLTLFLALAVAMMRPEWWPFLGIYGLWMLWTRRTVREFLILSATAVLIPICWLVPEKIGSGSFSRAADRASKPAPGAATFADSPTWEVFKSLLDMTAWAAIPLTIIGLLVSARHPLTREASKSNRRAVYLLVAIAVSWFAIVAAMTEGGFSGNARYILPCAALLAVSAGFSAGELFKVIGSFSRGTPVKLALLAAIAAVTVSAAVVRLPKEMRFVLDRSRLDDGLPNVIEAAGGRSKIIGCLPLITNNYTIPEVAWELRLHIKEVTYETRGPEATIIEPVKAFQGLPVVNGVDDLKTVAATDGWHVLSNCDSVVGK